MSYNDYNNLSPHFQSGAEQDGRSHPPYQDTAGTSSGGYQRQKYSSMNTNAASEQSISAQTSAERSSTVYSMSRPVEVSDTSSRGYHIARGRPHGHGTATMMSHYPSNSRSSIDTTALGNLAYASSLGQNSRSHAAAARDGSMMQHIVDYNRSGNNSNYSGSPVYGMTAVSINGYDLRRSDSRGAVNTRDEARPTEIQSSYGSSYSTYAQDAHGSRQPQQYVSSHESSRFPQPTSGPNQGASNSSALQYSNPPRPASGQGVHASRARFSSRGTNSPGILPSSNYSLPVSNEAMNNGAQAWEYSQQQPRPQPSSNSQSWHQTPAAQQYEVIPTPVTLNSRNMEKVSSNKFRQTKQTTANTALGSAQNTQNIQKSTPGDTHREDRSRFDIRSSALDNRASGNIHEKSPQPERHYPATVDPYQIFDNANFEKQRAAERAAAAAAAKAEKAQKATEEATAKNMAIKTSVNGTPADSDSATKNQMESEMKQMIEKMRDYKAKDPTLFSQIWEQVKKEQPPNRVPVKDALNVEENKGNITSLANSNGQLPSPNPTNSQLPLEPEFSIQLLPGNEFDRGKYPALRRRRKSNKEPANRALARRETLDHNNVTPVATPMVYPSSAGPAVITSTNESLVPAPGAQSMETAIKSFNRSMSPGKHADPKAGPSSQEMYVRGPELPASQPTKAAPLAEKPSSGTIWPQDKKWSLAFAAQDALISTSMNAGKNISVGEIVRLLDQSPSYAELCEILERRGFIIDRGHFARLLLSAVPSLNTTNSEEQQSSTVNVPNPPPSPYNPKPFPVNSQNSLAPVVNSQVRTTGVYGEGKPQTAIDKSHVKKRPVRKSRDSIKDGNGSIVRFGMLVPAEISKSAVTTTEGPGLRYVNWTPQGVAMAEGGNANFNQYRLNESGPAIPTQPSKKEMAKKRSFAELVDLTQDLSDEDDKIQQLKARLNVIHGVDDAVASSTSSLSAPGAVSDRPTAKTIDPALREKKKYPKNVLGIKDRLGLSSSATTEDEGLDLSKFKYRQSQQDLLQSSIIVRPMDKRNDALRRSTYNPRTIARDILVSSSKHPTMAPLNHHLDILRRRFAYVDHHSDLGTFRWDLVDPGGPDVSDIAALDVDMNDADDEDINIGADDRQRMQMAVTAEGAEGVVTLGSNVSQPMKGFPSRRVLEGAQRNGSQKPLDNSTLMDPHQGTVVLFNQNDEESVQQDVAEGNSMSFVRSPEPGTATASLPIATLGSVSNSPRGRPRGSGEKKHGNGFHSGPLLQQVAKTTSLPQEIAQSSATPQETNPGASQQKRRGRPLNFKNSPNTERSRGSQRAIPPHPRSSDTVPLRPSGLRNAMTPSDGFAIVINPRSSSIPVVEKKQKSVSKESKRREKSSMQPSTPSHKIYKCLWKNCPYELHNLETLRKHVRKHRQEFTDGPFPCLWVDCGMIKGSTDERDDDEELEPLEFASEEAWERHMERKHVGQYAWEFGDGPSTNPSDAEASDYLSDSHGRRVTPVVNVSSKAPPDPLPPSSGRITARAYHKAHGNKTELEKAKAILASVEAKKRATGLGITRQGATFVTEEMRTRVRPGKPGYSLVTEDEL